MQNQKKIRNHISGWLVINKPVGMTSTRVVAIVKRFFNAKKVGHAGTLDPLAYGVLPIALGEATKTISFSMDADKEYIFKVKWGQETSTGDAEGEVTQVSKKIPSKEEILNLLPDFRGQIEQVPPAFSAIKVNGKRAYDLARSGKDVKIKPRKVIIKQIELLSTDKQFARFRVQCTKGTYIRSLARDLAEKLGTRGHVVDLLRTRVGKFCINNTILLEKLEKTVYKAESSGLLLPVEEVLDDIPVLSFTPEEARALRQGQKVKFVTNGFRDNEIVTVKSNDYLIGLGEVGDGYIKPTRVFNL